LRQRDGSPLNQSGLNAGVRLLAHRVDRWGGWIPPAPKTCMQTPRRCLAGKDEFVGTDGRTCRRKRLFGAVGGLRAAARRPDGTLYQRKRLDKRLAGVSGTHVSPQGDFGGPASGSALKVEAKPAKEAGVGRGSSGSVQVSGKNNAQGNPE